MLGNIGSVAASASIVADFVKINEYSEEFKLKIEGRGTSVLGGGIQGDHVTAFGLVKRGIVRIFDKVGLTRVDDLDSLRGMRGAFLDYVGAISIIDPWRGFAQKTRQSFEQQFEQYDKHRIKKHIINNGSAIISQGISIAKDFSQLQGGSAGIEKYISEAVEFQKDYGKLVEAGYISNCYKMCDAIKAVARAVLTHYNHIASTAFLYISSAPSMSEGTCLDRLDNICAKLQTDAKYDFDIKEATSCISGLFYYPLISNEENVNNLLIKSNSELLEKWRSEARTGKTNLAKTAIPRTNEIDIMKTVVARHMLILYAAYPELLPHRKVLEGEFTYIFLQSWSPYLEANGHNITVIQEEIMDIISNSRELSTSYIESLHGVAISSEDEELSSHMQI